MSDPSSELHHAFYMNPRGVLAELRAVHYLRRHGYRVMSTRWHGGGGEIDIVAREGGLLVFIEVKSSPRLGEGAQRVDNAKTAHLRRAASAYLYQYGQQAFRFDILEESDAGFRLIRNAF